MDVRESYDSAAEAYAERLFAELSGKPLDRHLLNRFAEEVRGRGLVVEVGCGPGQIARYLHEQGVDVVGLDLSPEMIRVAQRLNPHLHFLVGDMRWLPRPSASLVGLVAFYAIVHFGPEDLAAFFREARRVLEPGGVLVLAFHIGDETVHVDELFGRPVSLDFRLHSPAQVVDALLAARLQVTEWVEREPYAGAEHPSRRCYLFARAIC